jgi:hypothetical protein
MLKLSDFIGNTALRAIIKRAASNPHMEDMGQGARHWLVTFKAGSRSMRVHFTQVPTAAEVLDCLASDAAGFENARSFEEWASEYGYDTDSRKAERAYKAISRQAAKLRALFGDANYETLLWNTERE